MIRSLSSRPSFFNTLTGMGRALDWRPPFQALHIKLEMVGHKPTLTFTTGCFGGFDDRQ